MMNGTRCRRSSTNGVGGAPRGIEGTSARRLFLTSIVVVTVARRRSANILSWPTRPGVNGKRFIANVSEVMLKAGFVENISSM